MTNYKFQKIVRPILVASAIVFLAVACTKQNSGDLFPQTLENQRQQIQVSHFVESVDKGDQLFNYYVDENKTALDLLKSGHEVETKTFAGVGEYVTVINGAKESPGKNFWALYVNGAQAQTGASDYKPKNGDKIVWQLEEIK